MSGALLGRGGPAGPSSFQSHVRMVLASTGGHSSWWKGCGQTRHHKPGVVSLHHWELVVKKPSLVQRPGEVTRILGINGSESCPPARLGDGMGSGPEALMQLSLRARMPCGSELRGQLTEY